MFFFSLFFHSGREKILGFLSLGEGSGTAGSRNRKNTWLSQFLFSQGLREPRITKTFIRASGSLKGISSIAF